MVRHGAGFEVITEADIDEQKRVQDDLRRVNSDLEQFAYSASHDLQEPLRTTLANVQGAIVESGTTVTFDPLPPVRVHSTHLRQLFQNLIGNAIKYRSPERAAAVHMSAERQSGFWVFTVSDNGTGIQP